mmetsp:Transcript_11347/g.42559  ORF Transcript_11347/g.42559 Transcript_11347/m.42559 type:complete len:119 (-) Transcript_11347:4178-4534(-)
MLCEGTTRGLIHTSQDSHCTQITETSIRLINDPFHSCNTAKTPLYTFPTHHVALRTTLLVKCVSTVKNHTLSAVCLRRCETQIARRTQGISRIHHDTPWCCTVLNERGYKRIVKVRPQ